MLKPVSFRKSLACSTCWDPTLMRDHVNTALLRHLWMSEQTIRPVASGTEGPPSEWQQRNQRCIILLDPAMTASPYRAQKNSYSAALYPIVEPQKSQQVRKTCLEEGSLLGPLVSYKGALIGWLSRRLAARNSSADSTNTRPEVWSVDTLRRVTQKCGTILGTD